jgi:hypothetical protein
VHQKLKCKSKSLKCNMSEVLCNQILQVNVCTQFAGGSGSGGSGCLCHAPSCSLQDGLATSSLPSMITISRCCPPKIISHLCTFVVCSGSLSSSPSSTSPSSSGAGNNFQQIFEVFFSKKIIRHREYVPMSVRQQEWIRSQKPWKTGKKRKNRVELGD